MIFSRTALRIAACAALALSLTACESKKFDPAEGAPKPAQVVEAGDMSLVTVDKPDQFPLVAAEQVEAPAE